MHPITQHVCHGHLIHYFREMLPEWRPQDPTRGGAGWTFQLVEHGGEYPDNMPQVMIASDARGRFYTLVANIGGMSPEGRPQDPTGDGAGWTFQTLEHGGEFADDMPRAIRATDAECRSCIYVPLRENGRVVDSICFEMMNDQSDVASTRSDTPSDAPPPKQQEAPEMLLPDSMIETAKLNGVEPMAWLTDVLERIVSGKVKANALEALLPWN
jgi:hypothetical protein